MALTHYEKILKMLGARSIERAQGLAEQCRGANNLDPMINHVARMIYEAQQAPDPRGSFDRMYRQSLVSFWATVQWAKAATEGYRYSTCCDLGYDKIVKVSACSNDPQGLNMQAQLCWHLAMHEQCGRKVYQVSPGLALNLSLTELRGLTTDLLHLPFEAVYIEVPREADLWVHNVDTDWHRCVGIYCVEDPEDAEGDRAWRIMAVGEPKGYERSNHEGMLLSNDALVHFRIKLRPGQKLDTVIDQAVSKMKRDVATVSPNFSGMLDEWPQVFRWLMNVVIYATWPDHEPMEVWANDEARKLWQKIQRGPSNARHVRKARKKLSALDRRKRTVLGHTIVLDRKLPRRSGPGTGQGPELAVRQRVAGHLKKVWYGEGKREWRIQRIDPYWRGPETGEVTNGTRRLK